MTPLEGAVSLEWKVIRRILWGFCGMVLLGSRAELGCC